VLNPERRSFHRTLNLTSEDLSCLAHAVFVRLVLQYIVDVVKQLIRCEVHRQTEVFVIKTIGVVILIGHHRKYDHRYSIIDSLIFTILSTVTDEEFHRRLC